MNTPIVKFRPPTYVKEELRRRTQKRGMSAYIVKALIRQFAEDDGYDLKQKISGVLPPLNKYDLEQTIKQQR